MKYSFRPGMFETNSSSTHAMSMFVDDKDERGIDFASYASDREDAVWNPDIRKIKSKKMKALLLYQFRYAEFASIYGNPKEYLKALLDGETEAGQDEMFPHSFPDLTTAEELSEFSRELAEVMTFKAILLEKIEDIYKAEKKEIDKMIKDIETRVPGYMTVCNECFWNDVLDTCTCGVTIGTIQSGLGIPRGNHDEELIDKVLADNVFFGIKEYWMGGCTFEIPDEL